MTEVAAKSQENLSDYVATLRQIDAEYMALNALKSFTEGAAKHQFINKRFENLGGYFKTLRNELGDDAATEVLGIWYDSVTGETRHQGAQS